MCNKSFFQLLRLSFGLTQEPLVGLSNEGWQQLYVTTDQQSLLGVCYAGASKQEPPFELAIQWASDAETIRGLNTQLYHEAARLTRLFAEQGHRTAILKGQANARLYPDKFSRQPGDIDIWVDGGRDNVIDLLKRMGLIDKLDKTIIEGNATESYHHVHLPEDEQGVAVEVHFRPSSGNFNPFTNRRLQRWLEQEILSTTMVDEGFFVPSIKFALVMQLAHIQRHFISGGIGLRHICDYYWLLMQSTEAERREVSTLLRKFGLRHTAGALMWVLGEVLRIDERLMLIKTDNYRGEWMLREIMLGGNFGHHSERLQTNSDIILFLRKNKQRLQLIPFAPAEVIWMQLEYWWKLFSRIPERIKYRRLSLRVKEL